MTQAADAADREYEARVIWYDRVKGYGFMALAGYGRDLLIHNTQVRAGDVGRDYLLKGDLLKCKVMLHKGRPTCGSLVMVKAMEG